MLWSVVLVVPFTKDEPVSITLPPAFVTFALLLDSSISILLCPTFPWFKSIFGLYTGELTYERRCLIGPRFMGNPMSLRPFVSVKYLTLFNSIYVNPRLPLLISLIRAVAAGSSSSLSLNSSFFFTLCFLTYTILMLLLSFFLIEIDCFFNCCYCNRSGIFSPFRQIGHLKLLYWSLHLALSLWFSLISSSIFIYLLWMSASLQ